MLCIYALPCSAPKMLSQNAQPICCTCFRRMLCSEAWRMLALSLEEVGLAMSQGSSVR